MSGIVLLAVLFVAACGDDDGDSLRPADEVRAEGEPPQVRHLDLGEPAEVGDMVVTVLGLEYVDTIQRYADASLDSGEPTEGERWLIVDVRVENSSDEEQFPDFNVRCASGLEGSRYVYEGTNAFEPLDGLPADSFDGGRMVFGVPLACEDGVLVAEATGVVTEDPPEPAGWLLPPG